MVHRVKRWGEVVVLTVVLSTASTPGMAQTRSGAATSTGTSRAFNPAISLNGLFLFSALPGVDPSLLGGLEHAHDDHHPRPGAPYGELVQGINVQEVELRFTANIDPYSRADATFAYHEGVAEIEEVYVTSNVLPLGFGMRGGKWYVPTSKENVLHTHQLPFIRRSLIGTALWGSHGYTDAGLELNWLAPLPFYTDLRASVFDGKNHLWFGSENGSDLAYYGGLSFLWDLAATTTFALEGNTITGKNGGGTDRWSRVAGAAAVFRWRPLKTQNYRSLRVQAEYMWGDRDADDPEQAFDLGGWYAYVGYRFSRRWWIQARYGNSQTLGFDEDTEAVFEEPDTRRASAMIALVPSEFQALRLEYSWVESPEDSWSEIHLQLNFTIGSHPAHRY